MSMDYEDQYDKIYRYCYFKVHKKEAAEDITQETFLRFLEHYDHCSNETALRYLYRIAHNLCVDEYRKPVLEQIPEELEGGESEDKVLNRILVKDVLAQLTEEEQEILLLRYVNEVPVTVICKLVHMSRFALYRKIKNALGKLRSRMGEEELN